MVFLGICGTVVALEEATGRRVWATKLKGYDYVSLLFDGNRVLAGAYGEIFCLETAAGKLLWHDGLKSYGRGLMAITTHSGSTDSSVAQARKKKEDEVSGVTAPTVAAPTAYWRSRRLLPARASLVDVILIAGLPFRHEHGR